jgi:hypothetical protein
MQWVLWSGVSSHTTSEYSSAYSSQRPYQHNHPQPPANTLQYCDLGRQYDPYPSPNTTTGTPTGTVVPKWLGGDIITPLLERFGKYDLLAYIQYFWINQGDYNWVFWQHG